MSSAQRDNENLRDALRNLTNGFNIVAKDRTPFADPSSKKLALFGVTNVLFKIYFKLNTLQLCSKLINVVERPGALNAIDHYLLFPVSDVVTYKFYIGRLKMFEDKYEDARFVSLSLCLYLSLHLTVVWCRDCFLFALRHTPVNHIKNRRQILASLVPVQMSLGVMPSEIIEKKYGLQDYLTLGRAVISGNLRVYEEVMQRNQREFIASGTYLVLEQVKLIAYRNLLKRIFSIVSNTRLKLTIVEE
jgi:nuclear mRNA export protein PCID2/THP1